MSKEPITKERLKRYIRIRQEVENQLERLERMEATLCSPSSTNLSGMPHGSFAVDRMAIAVSRKIELEETIKAGLEKECQEVKELEEGVQLLEEPNERQVIRMRYFDGLTWLEICEALFGKKKDYSERAETYERRTYKIHGTALVHIQQATTPPKQEKA